MGFPTKGNHQLDGYLGVMSHFSFPSCSHQEQSQIESNHKKGHAEVTKAQPKEGLWKAVDEKLTKEAPDEALALANAELAKAQQARAARCPLS